MNWLQIGSPQGGPKVAAILSVGESCRRLNLPPRDYFSSVRPGLADLSIQRVSYRTPVARALHCFYSSSSVMRKSLF